MIFFWKGATSIVTFSGCNHKGPHFMEEYLMHDLFSFNLITWYSFIGKSYLDLGTFLGTRQEISIPLLSGHQLTASKAMQEMGEKITVICNDIIYDPIIDVVKGDWSIKIYVLNFHDRIVYGIITCIDAHDMHCMARMTTVDRWTPLELELNSGWPKFKLDFRLDPKQIILDLSLWAIQTS